MKYGITMTIKEISADPAAAALMDRYLPGIREKLSGMPGADSMSIQKIAQYAKGMIPREALTALDAALTELGKTAGPTEAELQEMAKYRAIDLEDKKKAAARAAKRAAGSGDTAVRYDAFHPGQVWLDTDGNRIQAHGGQVLYDHGAYYWIGENKEHTDGGRTSDIWTWGIRAYRSQDLYNWEDLGLIIPPVLNDPDSNLFPDRHLDRPHIVYNPGTAKYVAWIKLSGEEACFIILEADALTGPYTVVRENYRPMGHEAGDFDIHVEEDGTAYLFIDADHKAVLGFLLDAQYHSARAEVSRQYEGLIPPFTREGITLFARGDRKYLLTSGMTGYIPNRSDAAVSLSWTAPFRSTGDPYTGEGAVSSWNSQFTQVFRVPGKKDLFIALSDRWVPGYPVDEKRADMLTRCIASRYDPEHYRATPEEMAEFMKAPQLSSADTHIADYVWLPIRFEGDAVRIDWKDTWRLSDYE